MISVGIDVAKGKSTVCILKPYGEIVSKPFDISHVEKDLGELAAMLLRFDDEVKVVMEATGIYHLPVLTYLQEVKTYQGITKKLLFKWLNRRSQKRSYTWDTFNNGLLKTFPLLESSIKISLFYR